MPQPSFALMVMIRQQRVARLLLCKREGDSRVFHNPITAVSALSNSKELEGTKSQRHGLATQSAEHAIKLFRYDDTFLART